MLVSVVDSFMSVCLSVKHEIVLQWRRRRNFQAPRLSDVSLCSLLHSVDRGLPTTPAQTASVTQSRLKNRPNITLTNTQQEKPHYGCWVAYNLYEYCLDYFREVLRWFLLKVSFPPISWRLSTAQEHMWLYDMGDWASAVLFTTSRDNTQIWYDRIMWDFGTRSRYIGHG